MKKLSIYICAVLTALMIGGTTIRAAQTDINGPAASNFGTIITILPNGNIVVTAPGYDIPGGALNVGAVYLYDGATLALISTLTGSSTNDFVGNGGLAVLTNGNFVVRSAAWNSSRGAATFCSAAVGCNGEVSASNSLVGAAASDQISSTGITALTNGNYVVASTGFDNGAVFNAGAVTWGNGVSGTSGTVSAANSLVGSVTSDLVGTGVTALTNGNYVVRSPNWDNGGIPNVGAVTWGNGGGGTSGTITAANSLVGSTANDQVGGSVTALTNGNYVVASQTWDNGAATNAGAVTFGNGVTGTSGAVSASNSLVGSVASDSVGNSGVVALTNGNYVVRSSLCDNGAINAAGAVTWGNGVTGVSGAVSASNSLVGSAASDQVGVTSFIALTNGNYVVVSALWDNGAATNAGAVTWGNGVSGTRGAVSSANSLVGSTISDNVGGSGVTALTNGNYVVSSLNWDNGGITNAGAATFGNGVSGVSGVVSASNSLVGSSANDVVSNSGIVALTNGNYVVASQDWDDGTLVNAGAATFGNGTTGISGTINSTNSLVGDKESDQIAWGGVTALTNGNYVVVSLAWNNGAAVDAGAVTWGNGVTGTTGTVTLSNSLVGSAGSDNIGSTGVTALTNGNYVVRSALWDNGAILGAGAVTWGNGTTGTTGVVGSANSLVGSTAEDNVGNTGVTTLPNGNYVVSSQNWDNGATTNAGAYTFGNGGGGTSGAITSGATGGNSVVGTLSNGISNFAFDATRNRLFVGRVASNAVSILSFTTTAATDGDLSSAANWSNGAPDGLVTGIIPSGRTMTISSKVNAGLIQVQCGGSLTGSSSAAYVIGSVRRDFCAAANESFVYPIGDANNYTPLAVSNTSGTGALTASVTDNFMTGLPQSKSLSRYWSLTGAGVTTNLTFSYTDADVNGTEANYNVFKRSASTNLTTTFPASSVNAAANTFTAANVSQFSDWSAGDAPVNLAPTAAGVSISGRVVLPGNRNLANAMVYLTTADGEMQQTGVSWKGDYRFEGIAAGQTVMITVFSKRYRFEPQVISVTEDLTDVNFAPLQ